MKSVKDFQLLIYHWHLCDSNQKCFKSFCATMEPCTWSWYIYGFIYI